MSDVSPAPAETRARRALDFESFDAVVADLRRLERGYARVGRWSLGECCDHLTKFMQFSIDGFPAPNLPAPLAWIIRQFTVNRTLKTRKVPAGVPTPKFLRPTLPAEAAAEQVVVAGPAPLERDAVERFVAAARRVEQHEGEFARSPIFGHLSPETWRDVHLIHASHHLGFLLPIDDAAQASRGPA